MEKNELKLRYENELLHTRLEVQEQALNQVSQEIHDNIGQSLSVAQANLDFLTGVSDTAQSQKLIDDSRRILHKALNDLRNVSHVLNSENINRIGLEESLKKELDYLSAYNKIQFYLHADGEPDSLSNEQELMIFRIAQEALANIIKHAEASAVQIRLEYKPMHFEMCVEDNGVGIKNDEKNGNGNGNGKGIGLINMKQRAKVMNGQLSVVSPPAGGTIVTLNLPYDN
ncbi:sensor histidine kinase [Polluticoccus soli]|uniref:sensor histidine kinase n=1 Tax=Polluticoccus soli TaxID=3034150 RepID=UPI0023E13542|nr:ATP-binding protein [Flavipsychrobacter sp. JY13-12]